MTEEDLYDVLMAHVRGDLTEGQAARLLDYDRVLLRETVQQCCQRGCDMWDTWRAEHPPEIPEQPQTQKPKPEPVWRDGQPCTWPLCGLGLGSCPRCHRINREGEVNA